MKMYEISGGLRSHLSDYCQGAEGNSLEHEMGVKTESLSPSHTFVPWIVVNGQHDDKIQMQAMQDLLALVCDLYQVHTNIIS